MAMIDRSAAEALIREQVASAIAQDVPKTSIVMQLGHKLPDMTSKQTRIPVLDVLPLAYWVNGDTGYRQMSRQAWENVYLTAGELAVIVPVPKNVLDDADFDIIGEVNPRVKEAVAKAVDEAVLFGINRPSEWQSDIVTLARQAGNNVAAGTNGAIDYDKLLGEGGVFAHVEETGYGVNGVVAGIGMRAKLRGLKDSGGRLIFVSDMQGATPYALDGAPLHFPTNGSFDASVAQMVAGDFSQLVWAMRKDIEVKLLDQAVIQDPATGTIVYNLAQQGMIALMVSFRMGWALPNPATRINGNRVGVPFAYLEPATAYTAYTATFTVSNGLSSTDLVLYEGAAVDVNGARIITDSDGEAEFHLRNGVYPYTVKLDGCRPYTGTLTVNGAAAAVPVTLTPKA